MTTGVGPLTPAAPQVNDRRVVAGVRQKFTRAILPQYVRRWPRVKSVLPVLYRHGLASGDSREALPALLGPDAAGLSSSGILRHTKAWTTKYEAFRAAMGRMAVRSPRAMSRNCGSQVSWWFARSTMREWLKDSERLDG